MCVCVCEKLCSGCSVSSSRGSLDVASAKRRLRSGQGKLSSVGETQDMSMITSDTANCHQGEQEDSQRDESVHVTIICFV